MTVPDPLTPPDCDLRGLQFMPLDVVRLLDSDLYALSSGDEFKAAVSLWCKAWLQVPAGSLPDDDRVLSRLSGAGSRWAKVKAVALRGFVKCLDGRLYHRALSEKALEAYRRRVEQRDRANVRWQTQKNDKGQTFSDSAKPEGKKANKNNETAHATALPPHMPPHMPRQCKGQGEGEKKEKKAASRPELDAARPPPPPPAEALLDRAVAELGVNLADLRRNLDWINLPIRIAEWRRQGATDADIWPTMRRILAKKGELPKSPSYFAPAVIEAKDRRIAEQGHTAAQTAALASLPPDHPTTKSRIAHFRSTGQWFDDWGPKPQEAA
jgi:uncharacterized protein YdaU (DUF1376 family)